MNKIYIFLLCVALVIPFFTELKYSIVILASIVIIFHAHFIAIHAIAGWQRAGQENRERNAEFIRNGQFGDSWKE